ncbi:MAG: protein kinase [Deltaproteobacteria bacterium]|nr:protein kinase [Deltaproteobacteria bacterium]
MTQEAATSDIPRPPVDLPVLGKFAGYDVLGRLALGGMAEILLTRHANTDGDHRFMVVKRILPHFEQDNDFVQMFLDEARIGMQLKHPNICQFHQFGADEGSHFIVMEWINGVPLGRMIRKARKTGGVGIPIAIRVGVDVARALHYAHIANDEHGEPFNIVHRDVSPHNVMIAYTGTVKLLDFGIAKADHRSHKTQAGVVKGKFAYMAPEQCTAGQADHRLDIFALGVCLFETLTGRSLYRRQTEAATMRAVIMDPVPSLKERLPDVADELDQILQKALPTSSSASAGRPSRSPRSARSPTSSGKSFLRNSPAVPASTRCRSGPRSRSTCIMRTIRLQRSHTFRRFRAQFASSRSTELGLVWTWDICSMRRSSSSSLRPQPIPQSRILSPAGRPCRTLPKRSPTVRRQESDRQARRSRPASVGSRSRCSWSSSLAAPQ